MNSLHPVNLSVLRGQPTADSASGSVTGRCALLLRVEILVPPSPPRAGRAGAPLHVLRSELLETPSPPRAGQFGLLIQRVVVPPLTEGGKPSPLA